jgi:hypothetical protein
VIASTVGVMVRLDWDFEVHDAERLTSGLLLLGLPERARVTGVVRNSNPAGTFSVNRPVDTCPGDCSPTTALLKLV